MPCATDYPTATVNVSGEGTIFYASGVAPDYCAYQITSSVPWIKPRHSIAGGAGGLLFLVRPNPGASARSGVVTIGSKQFTVAQDPAPPASNFGLIGYTVELAEYSKSLDRLILFSRDINEHHIYDPISKADQIVEVPFLARR